MQFMANICVDMENYVFNFGLIFLFCFPTVFFFSSPSTFSISTETVGLLSSWCLRIPYRPNITTTNTNKTTERKTATRKWVQKKTCQIRGFSIVRKEILWFWYIMYSNISLFLTGLTRQKVFILLVRSFRFSVSHEHQNIYMAIYNNILT